MATALYVASCQRPTIVTHAITASLTPGMCCVLFFCFLLSPYRCMSAVVRALLRPPPSLPAPRLPGSGVHIVSHTNVHTTVTTHCCTIHFDGTWACLGIVTIQYRCSGTHVWTEAVPTLGTVETCWFVSATSKTISARVFMLRCLARGVQETLLACTPQAVPTNQPICCSPNPLLRSSLPFLTIPTVLIFLSFLPRKSSFVDRHAALSPHSLPHLTARRNQELDCGEEQPSGDI